MNKYLLITSLFFCNVFFANEESITTEPATEIFATTETISADIEESIKISVSESEATLEKTVEIQTEDALAENNSASEFKPTSFVFDFVMELENLTEDWTSLIDSTNELVSRCQDTKKDIVDTALNLAQEIYKHAISKSNNAHGILSASLYESDNDDIKSEIISTASNYITIRLILTRNNENNSSLWATFQDIVQAALEALQSIQSTTSETDQTEEVTQEEIQIIEATNISNEAIIDEETAESTESNQAAEQVNVTTQESPITIISNTVQEILALARQDDNNSVSTRLYINSATKNTAG